jgi:pyruvate dehydrogenase E2 component (dihydrolipoamide acetyltransferase)
MGMYDVESFTAIINPGEVGILAVATAYQVPRVINGKIKIRQVMKMTLSADHRLIDGKTSADFLRAIKNKLENVNLWEQIVGLNACVKKVRGNRKGK